MFKIKVVNYQLFFAKHKIKNKEIKYINIPKFKTTDMFF